MKKLFLFDIDGTLISPSNIARKLLDKIFLDEFGKSPSFKYDDVAGSTDLAIVANGLSRIKIKSNSTNELIERVLKLYIAELGSAFEKSPKPFVYKDTIKLLNKVREKRCSYGILTGNIKAAAKIKLKKFNLWKEFSFGVYGEDANSRSDLVWLAREKAWEELEESFRFKDIILVGDTVSDAEAASKNGAKSIIASRIDDKKAALEESSATIVVDDLNQVNLNDFIN
tara:strand:- start:108 stop:788 length:681 start_codon:yes stop_codon:yes gene_type:complete